MAETKAAPVFFGGAPPFPISRAVRAGDFVITCAMGDRVFTPEEGLYDEHGRVVSTGTRLQALTFAEEVHATFKALEESLALAGCALADVIDCQVWRARLSRVQPHLCRLLRDQPAGALRISHRLHVRLPDRDEGRGIQASPGWRSDRSVARARRGPECLRPAPPLR